MRQYESVIAEMEKTGGFATLGHLYQKVDISEWKTKTPFASIRRIVQDERFFFKIKPGLWALNTSKECVLKQLDIDQKKSFKRFEEFNHTYFQGQLVEIGNLEGFKTFVPYQDKNKKYLTKPLDDITTIKKFYQFTYNRIVARISTVDVSWFNERNFPASLFEIEHTTNFDTSLLKFMELQDFNVKLNIVADKAREKEFIAKISSSAFNSIRPRVKFVSYDQLADFHSKIHAIAMTRNSLL